jgi:hypothetical protein
MKNQFIKIFQLWHASKVYQNKKFLTGDLRFLNEI